MYIGNVEASPRLAVDVVAFSLIKGELSVLLVERRRAPYLGYWALPGRFVGLKDGLEAAAHQALEEKAGARGLHLEQLHAFDQPERDPRGRVITIAFYALLPPGGTPVSQGAGWFSVNELPPLAFDHGEIIAYAHARLRDQLFEAPVVRYLLPRTFTLSELQDAYEVILGRPLDRRNFRKRILKDKTLEPVGERRGGPGRPAVVYRFSRAG